MFRIPSPDEQFVQMRGSDSSCYSKTRLLAIPPSSF